MSTGVQWQGTLNPGETRRWFTYGWPAAAHVIWYMMPTSPRPGAPQLEWEVAVERSTAVRCSYWITVRNLTPSPVAFEGRFAILS